jgi:AraC family transcriptional regulator
MSRFSDTRVEVRQFSPMPVAYVRHIGPYKGDNALFERLWGTLMRWAGPRGLLQQPALKCLCLYHDDPNVTDESHLRTSVCISVPPQTAVSGEVGLMEVPGGSYAAAYCELDSSEYEQAWNWVYGQWLPHSGYQPDDRPCFELMLNDPATHPQHKHVVEICVPVRPL